MIKNHIGSIRQMAKGAAAILLLLVAVLPGPALAGGANTQRNVNPTGGVAADGSDGLRWQLGSNSQFQVYLGGAGQVYSPPSTPVSGNLFNSVYLRVDRGTDATTRIYNNSNFGAAVGVHPNANLPFVQVSQSAINGAGTAASPWQVTTVLRPSNPADSGITVTVVDRYVSPESWLTRRVTLSGMPASGAAIKFYQHVDTYLQGGDNGPGFARTSAWNTTGIPDIVGVNKGAQFQALWYEPSSGTPHWDRYSSETFMYPIHQMCRSANTSITDPCVTGLGNLSNTVNPFAGQDHGMAAQWNIPSGASTFTLEYRVTFAIGAVDLTKAFEPETIHAGGTSTLTFNLNNRTINSVASINFTDSLPPEVRVAAAPNIRTSCPGGGTLGSTLPSGMSVTAVAGSNTIQIAGASVNGATSVGSERLCKIAVDVTSSVVGQHHNTNASISGTNNLVNLVGDEVLTVLDFPDFGSCPADAYITRGDTAITVRLYTLGLANGAMTDQGTSPALADQVNGIGFRQQDGYIWGWGNGATVRRLVRIGVGGVADVPYATAPAGLPAAPQFYSADVSPAGIYTGVIGNQLWFINVATNTLAGPPVTLASSDIGTDIAYHPTDGNLYTVRSSSGEVVRINPATGAVTPIGISLPNAAPGGFGGVFFDNQGTLYAYKSNSPGGTGLVYRVFNVDGSGTLAYDLLSTSLTAASLDGARCPVAPPQGAPALILRKTTTGGFSGPFAFAINNTVDTSGTATTTAAGTPVQVDGDDSTPGVQPFTVETAALGRSLTINEANLPTGWRLTGATCRVDGTAVGSLTDTTYTIPGASVVTGALFECDFTNALRQTDIQVVKTASPNPVVSSDVVTYQIVVTNNGPLAADGAVLTDVAGVGQDCATPSTTATCSATGGATCPSPTVPVSSLLGSGITIPTLPVGGQVTIGLQCTVSASGTP